MAPLGDVAHPHNNLVHPSLAVNTAKKEQQDVKTDTEKAEPSVPKSDDADNTEDKKRDWKDEKGEAEEVVPKLENTEDEKVEDAEGKMDTSAGAEDAALKETKEASDKSEKDNAKATGKKSEARHAESRYAEVPMSHMFCHICNKHMWDGFSFENHLRGRAHQLMMDKLDESYKLKVDLMRHELRVAEEQRQLSLNNSKRRGKKVSVDFNVREYCTMCDLNFYGTLSMHRKSEKHQQLKTFLHPRCFPCLKEFPSRIEYDEHCLTPTHMKNAKLAKGEAEVRTAEDEDKDVCHDAKNDKEEDVGEQEYVMDITENMNERKFKVPSYNIAAASDRYRITHYRNFVSEVKSLTSNTTAAETKETEGRGKRNREERKKERHDECDGNWKRRKIDNGKDEGADTPPRLDKEAIEDKVDAANVAPKKSDGEEKYDPLEADATESEEEENRETEVKVETATVAGNAANVQDKKLPVEEAWADIDNDDDIEMSNLIDDADEKEHADHEKSMQKVDRNPGPQDKLPHRHVALLRKCTLDEVGGLKAFGIYLAEDFFYAKSLTDRGWRITVSSQPALQNSGNCEVNTFQARLRRWAKLRVAMLPPPSCSSR
ncbi:hypothetical protein DMN91_012490 [Ooceraea biroi]|uniref:CIZ1 C2H2-type zinc finger domain-containing protein n=1 Tax=Ooceraea biroi TaxID=2015173 RepID=A0A3L8D5I8_OOCBI|nr:hypothetical protein DMN91_012490 [Ooceraea biroi]